ncbi:hypothetical protein WUBG_00305 [Wuchereria bancrofti]|uniref:DNA_pol_alpha_N domain-containing protein n=1 Tax=Wuchereria bancrofti TaxID=6293 RepID=J9F2N1_WUCBA|nr:hypothetical protein WUBG_00305 [Wuchereria bancrofti]
MSSSDEEIVVRNPYATTASNGRRSSHRSHVSREQESKSRALKEMKRARDAGIVHRVDVANLVKPVYEEVDEDEYVRIVQERQRDDFVVDDDGSGYVDHGFDFFDEEQCSATRKAMKAKERRGSKVKRKGIGDFFHALNIKKMKEENAVTVTDDPDVEALLNECDLSNFLKKSAIEKVGVSKTDNVSLMRNHCFDSKITAKSSKAHEMIKLSERKEHLNGTASQSPSPISDAGKSMNLESTSKKKVEKVFSKESVMV